MKYRSKMTKSSSQGLFARTSAKTHYKNLIPVNPMVMRGGTRL